MRMGLREANQQFSKAMKAVRAGQEVVLTERGKPIAVIKPLREPAGIEAAVRRMEASGLLIPARVRRPLPPARPIIKIRGKPLSATLSELRDSR
jgi:prevent-host-death family protein